MASNPAIHGSRTPHERNPEGQFGNSGWGIGIVSDSPQESKPSSSESKRTFSAQQQANFAKNSDNEGHGISICLPRVFRNIGYKRVLRHMRELNFGFIERVDVVPVYSKDGTISHNRAFVHFAKGGWNMRDPTARAALKALKSGRGIKIEYEAPWYWLAVISGAKRPDEAPKPYERPEYRPRFSRTLSFSEGDIETGDFGTEEITTKPKNNRNLCEEFGNCSIQGGKKRRRKSRKKRKKKKRRKTRRKRRTRKRKYRGGKRKTKRKN